MDILPRFPVQQTKYRLKGAGSQNTPSFNMWMYVLYNVCKEKQLLRISYEWTICTLFVRQQLLFEKREGFNLFDPFYHYRVVPAFPAKYYANRRQADI